MERSATISPEEKVEIKVGLIAKCMSPEHNAEEMEEMGSTADSEEDARPCCAQEGHKSQTIILAKRPILHDVDVSGSKMASFAGPSQDQILGEPIEAPEEIPHWIVKGQ